MGSALDHPSSHLQQLHEVDQAALLRAACRRALGSFTQKAFSLICPGHKYEHNWHIDALTYHLERVVSGDIRRLIITLPPRSLKSICTSVALPAFILGHDPSARIIAVSYSQDLADKHARDCKMLMEHPYYQSLFPQTQLSPHKSAVREFTTPQGGFRLATSLGGTLTGRGGQYIILDDPMKPEDALSETMRRRSFEWFSHTLLSRLDDKSQGAIILVMQRLHVDDLVGYILDKHADDLKPLAGLTSHSETISRSANPPLAGMDQSSLGADHQIITNHQPYPKTYTSTQPFSGQTLNGWVHLNLPAIAEEDMIIPVGPNQIHHRLKGDVLHPTREPRASLEQLTQTMGRYNFTAQYQQDPAPLSGGLIKPDWFCYYKPPLGPDPSDIILQSWDTAQSPTQKANYSVCTTWSLKKQGATYDCYLLDVYREQIDYPTLRRRILSLAEQYKPRFILIENKGSGISLIQDLKYLTRLPLKAITPKHDKLTRMQIVTPILENAHVYIPQKAPWLSEFLLELARFPQGRHDDQVDSLSQALNWAQTQLRTPRLPSIRRRVYV